jgi:hypothetical protein
MQRANKICVCSDIEWVIWVDSLFMLMHNIAAHKLFVGMLTKTTSEQDLQNIFLPFGEVEEVAILRGPNNVGKGMQEMRNVVKGAKSKRIFKRREVIIEGEKVSEKRGSRYK